MPMYADPPEVTSAFGRSSIASRWHRPDEARTWKVTALRLRAAHLRELADGIDAKAAELAQEAE